MRYLLLAAALTLTLAPMRAPAQEDARLPDIGSSARELLAPKPGAKAA